MGAKIGERADLAAVAKYRDALAAMTSDTGALVRDRSRPDGKPTVVAGGKAAIGRARASQPIQRGHGAEPTISITVTNAGFVLHRAERDMHGDEAINVDRRQPSDPRRGKATGNRGGAIKTSTSRAMPSTLKKPMNLP
jgi:hypothetical protein